MRDLQGRRIIVGGGATGIGAATAARLADGGARVVVEDINSVGLDALQARFNGNSGQVIPCIASWNRTAS